MRYWSTLPHTDLAQSEEWLGRMIADDPGARQDFIVEYQGRAIGKAGCYRLPEIGYIIHPDFWGRGLASEALTAVIDHIFGHHDIDALRADVDPRNFASIRLLEKHGFTVSGTAAKTWQIGGQWCDSIYLTLPRPMPLSQSTH